MPKMSQIKTLKGDCSHCRGRLEFPADAIGAVADCPHCGQSTELTLAAPPPTSPLPVKAIIWTLVAVLILGGGLAGAMIALKRAQKMAARQKERVTQDMATNETTQATTLADLNVSPIVLEKAQGSSLVHAVGTVRNTASRQRFGVKVEVDLFDAAGQRLGAAQDYQPVIEPNAEWRFKALVMQSKVTAAKLASVKEDQ